MRDYKYTLTLDGYERRQLLLALNDARNLRIREGKATEPVDELMIKAQNMPQKRRWNYAR